MKAEINLKGLHFCNAVRPHCKRITVHFQECQMALYIMIFLVVFISGILAYIKHLFQLVLAEFKKDK